MKRTILLLSISVLATLILGWVNLVEAQQAGKVYRIGYIAAGGRHYDIFRQRLRELGYVEGQNLVIERHSVSPKGGPRRARARAREPLAELVRLKVDVIVAGGARAYIDALQRATRTIPIVSISMRVDPVKAGFAVSLARPGGNITGLTNLASRSHGKRLELLKEAFPRISRVSILWSPPQAKQAMKEVQAVAQALEVQIQSVVPRRVGRDFEDIESVLSAISQERPDALLVATGYFMAIHQARIIEFASKRRLPTIFAWSRFVNAGGLMSYGVDFEHLYGRAATYVDKILKGAKPGDLPVERPTKFDFVVNLKTAKALGLTIPPAVLLQATEVIIK